jgi:hypothetical protein
MATDGRLIAHLHGPASLLDVVDDEWRQECLGHDDFDLPSADFDSDNDEGRTVTKRGKDDEKWTELCLEEFQQPPHRPATGGMH